MAPKPKGKKGPRPAEQEQQEQAKPDWPAFNPLLPASDLSIETIVPNQIVVIRNFWRTRLPSLLEWDPGDDLARISRSNSGT